MNTELPLNQKRAGSNKAWKKCKRYLYHRLSENTNMPEINIRKPGLEQANNKLQDHIVANKGMQESTKCINQKSLIDQEPKRHRHYYGTQVNIASFVNRFRLSRKLSMA